MKELRFVQARAKTSNPPTSVPNRKKRWLILFGLWLIVGLTVAALIGPPIGRTLAQSKLKLERFDTDVYPAIYVAHLPPLIAKTGEMIKLEFNFACGYIRESGVLFNPRATLYVTYGAQQDARPIMLTEESHDGMRTLVAQLPSSDEQGQSLRYYVEVNDPQFDLTVRYPSKGTIDLFAATKFALIALPEEGSADPGELVLALPWGKESAEVGLLSREEEPFKKGPSALDVAEDGRIALLDNVNERVLIFQPKEDRFKSLPVIFPLKGLADIQFNRGGQVIIFDPEGEQTEPSKALIPQIYRLSPEGLVSRAPVFVKIPAWLTGDLTVVDLADSKQVVPFNDLGEANEREIQQHKRTAEFLVKHVTNEESRFVDLTTGSAFQVHSASPLGAISLFTRVPQGYLAVFETENLRAIWFDVTGNVLKDVTVAAPHYSEVNPYGRMATDQQGSLYVLSSIETGAQVRLIKPPD